MKLTNPARRLLTALIVTILLLLDWAALHDIIEGESNTTLEYAMAALSLVVFLMLFSLWIRTRRRSVQAL